jgi:long-chain acyl-CoA synthetase
MTTSTTTTTPAHRADEHHPANTSTICAAFQASACAHPYRIALREVDGRQWTWAQYAAAVERAAGALASLGVARGDRVAFLSRNIPELLIAETAAVHLGAAGVALYVASPARTIEHVLRDSTPQVLLVEPALAPRLRDVEHEVPHVVSLTTPLETAPALDSLQPPPGFAFDQCWRAVQADDLLGILYTSGTTGLPKGVEWQHGPMMEILRAFNDAWPEGEHVRDLCVGPFAHAGERGLGQWRSHLLGSTRTVCPDPALLPAALLDTRPTFLFGSPQLWQGVRALVLGAAQDQEREVLQAALAGAAADGDVALAGLRSRVGLDALTRAVTAAAPCPLAVQELFHALGVPFGEFYGMTEIGAATQTRPGTPDLGSTGVALRGVDVRLADDGEVLVRGPRARGYRNRPEETAAVFGTDGWTRTGDMGALDGAGRLRIVDRKREILISTDGHNTAPGPIEAAVKGTCSAIGQVCVIGDERPHNVALVTLNPAAGSSEEVLRQVAATIDFVNADLDPRERIVRHTVLDDPWLPGSDELTETGKLRRRIISTRHADAIQSLYSPAGVTRPSACRQAGRPLLLSALLAAVGLLVLVAAPTSSLAEQPGSSATGLRQVAHLPVPGAITMAFSSRQPVAYVLARKGGGTIVTVDVSDPVRPRALAELPVLSTAYMEDLDIGERADGSTFLPVREGDGVRVVDVTDPRKPVARGLLAVESHTWTCVTVECTHALGTRNGFDDSSRFSVVDLSDLDAPRLAAMVPSPVGVIHDWNRDGAGVLWASGGNGIAAFDLASPTRPVLLNATDLHGTKGYSEHNDRLHLHSTLRPHSGPQVPSAPADVRHGNVLLAVEEGNAVDCTDSVQTWHVPHLDAQRAPQVGADPLVGSIRPLDTWSLAQDAGVRSPATTQLCGLHWFDYHQEGFLVVAAYASGTRVLDVRDAHDIREVGRAADGDDMAGQSYWVPERDAHGRSTGRRTDLVYSLDVGSLSGVVLGTRGGVDVFQAALPRRQQNGTARADEQTP